MKFLWIVFILAFDVYALDFGDGSDGACTEATILASGTFNCTTLTISAGNHDIAGAGILTIKVQGDVNIIGNLRANGVSGDNGSTLVQPASGGTAVAGGSSGGDSVYGQNTAGSNGSSPVANAQGLGGQPGIDGGGSAGGGGGSGGNHNSSLPATGGPTSNGSAGGGSTGGAGGAIPSASYGSELLFETTMQGGAGGGAGAHGSEFAVPADHTGGAGGGGGGAIRIWSNGDVSVTGSIQVNGGAGGNGFGDGATGPSGGGGGGAGGSLWLYSTGTITLAALTSLQASEGGGGTGGPGNVNGGPGGDGATGRIRLDDSDGSVVNAPGFAVILSSGSSAPLSTYESDIALGCGTIQDISKSPPKSGGPFLIILFFIPLLILKVRVTKNGELS